MKRSVFFLSDRTGITAEALGHSLLTQFEGVEFRQTTLPFIDSRDKAHQAIERINHAAAEDGARPLLFSTLVDPELRELVGTSEGLMFDFFDTFINPLEIELGRRSSHAVGRSHGIHVYAAYKARIDAVNFALSNDDGVTTREYANADIILVGVSRSGKTPTCLYLALQYGIWAANYPITEEDLESSRLPEVLAPFRDQMFGLTISPQRLQQIRGERRPNSRYATLQQCEFEVKAVEGLYRREGIDYLDTSTVSIEEIATTILHMRGLERQLQR
jgi:regulator of PEP synthase PpsR (kinase-PPPase family)